MMYSVVWDGMPRTCVKCKRKCSSYLLIECDNRGPGPLWFPYCLSCADSVLEIETIYLNKLKENIKKLKGLENGRYS